MIYLKYRCNRIVSYNGHCQRDAERCGFWAWL